MKTNPDTLRADARHNYDRLVRAAVMLFALKGPTAPLTAIAEKAGVGIGTLYRHFPTRKALLEAVFADRLSELTAKAQSLLQTNPADKALLSWLRVALEYTVEYTGFAELIALALEDKNSPLVTAGSNLLFEGQRQGLLRNDISIAELLQLVNGIAAGDRNERGRIDKLLSVVVAGFKAGLVVHPSSTLFLKKRSKRQ